MRTRRSFLRAVASLPPLFFVSRSGLAQNAWPTRYISAVNGFLPGSGADTLARFYARKLQDDLGSTVVVVNKAGAFGNIATEFVARAKPDGYTILITPGFSTLAAAPSLFKTLSFDPVSDFEHVTTLSKVAFVLVVAGSSPFQSVSELTQHLKERGDKAFYGSVSNTGVAASELYKAWFKLQTVEVKYRDPSAMLTDLYAGSLAFSHFDPIQAAGPLREGRLRALAISAKDRFVSLPNIPSASEAGIGNSDIIAWWSVHTPKNTPKSVTDKLAAIFNAIVASQEHQKFLAPLGSDPFPGNSEKLKEQLAKDIKAWREYVKIAKIEPV